jgi:hypothetical protein
MYGKALTAAEFSPERGGFILNKAENSALRFFNSKTFKAMYGKGLEALHTLSKKNTKVTLIDKRIHTKIYTEVSCII